MLLSLVEIAKISNPHPRTNQRSPMLSMAYRSDARGQRNFPEVAKVLARHDRRSYRHPHM